MVRYDTFEVENGLKAAARGAFNTIPSTRPRELRPSQFSSPSCKDDDHLTTLQFHRPLSVLTHVEKITIQSIQRYPVFAQRVLAGPLSSAIRYLK